MNDRIETMRTRFAGAGHAPVEPVMFAAGMLRTQKAAVEAQLRQTGWVQAEHLGILAIELGDPAEPIDDAPVTAVVNAGRWIAPCECGGAEYVDPENPIAMCASCFNAAHGHRWRRVELPDARSRALIERLLLYRPNARTRNWKPEESAAQLAAENVLNGVMKAGDEAGAGDQGVST